MDKPLVFTPDIMKGNLTAAIVKKHGKAPIQVALKWLTDAGMPIMIKTTNCTYMRQNLELFDWTISPTETALLDAHHTLIPYL